MSVLETSIEVDFGPLVNLLTEIRDRLPEALPKAPDTTRKSMDSFAVVDAKRDALRAVLETLDAWIEGAQANHEGFGHSSELIGAECWTRYTPQDIRAMVNDAAREVGVGEFDPPAHPVEDRR